MAPAACRLACNATPGAPSAATISSDSTPGGTKMQVNLSLNGKPATLDADPQMPLLWALREVAGLTGTKFGCGIAACGACTVHVNGAAVRSCVYPLSAAAGAKVTTIEGLAG